MCQVWLQQHQTLKQHGQQKHQKVSSKVIYMYSTFDLMYLTTAGLKTCVNSCVSIPPLLTSCCSHHIQIPDTYLQKLKQLDGLKQNKLPLNSLFIVFMSVGTNVLLDSNLASWHLLVVLS